MRDRNHALNEKGYSEAELDKSSSNPDAIRGREQMNIEASGNAQSQGGTSGNTINGVSGANPNRGRYMSAAEAEFGESEMEEGVEGAVTAIPGAGPTATLARFVVGSAAQINSARTSDVKSFVTGRAATLTGVAAYAAHASGAGSAVALAKTTTRLSQAGILLNIYSYAKDREACRVH